MTRDEQMFATDIAEKLSAIGLTEQEMRLAAVTSRHLIDFVGNGLAGANVDKDSAWKIIGASLFIALASWQETEQA